MEVSLRLPRPDIVKRAQLVRAGIEAETTVLSTGRVQVQERSYRGVLLVREVRVILEHKGPADEQ